MISVFNWEHWGPRSLRVQDSVAKSHIVTPVCVLSSLYGPGTWHVSKIPKCDSLPAVICGIWREENWVGKWEGSVLTFQNQVGNRTFNIFSFSAVVEKIDVKCFCCGVGCDFYIMFLCSLLNAQKYVFWMYADISKYNLHVLFLPLIKYIWLLAWMD